MTEQELNVFLDLEWNCAAFTPDTEHISAPLSPKQWACIISRHPELQELCPFSEFTTDNWIKHRASDFADVSVPRRR